MKKILVISGGGHAKVVISILKKLKKYDIAGYSDIKNRGIILGVKYIGDDETAVNSGLFHAAIGIGILKNSSDRKKIISKYQKKGFVFPPIISPDAIINEDVTIGNGTVVMDGVIINSGTSIGNCSIINTSSSLDHDCEIKNNVHVAPGATLCGGVKVGDNCFLGANTTIIQNIDLVEGCIIGASSLVNRNCDKAGRYVGVPAVKV